MKSRTVEKSLKTISVLFTIDMILALIAKNSEYGGIFVLLTSVSLLYAFHGKANDRAKQTIVIDNSIFKRERDGNYYLRENGSPLMQLNQERAKEILNEKDKIENIPGYIIDGGEEMFDDIRSLFS